MGAIAAGIGGNAVVSDRVAGFDLLRGVCAIAVAIYHVLVWNGGPRLYTWGSYGVYIFFVLSGASMYVAYNERFSNGYSLARFLGLRLVRLMPLYILALVGTLTLQFRQTGFNPQDLMHGFLNVGFIFGLGNPGTTSEVVGGWSLGIEFMFYLLFPVTLALLSGRWWWLVLLIAFAAQHVFIWTVFSNGKGLGENFSAYTQFLSFIFYFAAGCVIGRAVHLRRIPAHWAGLPILVGALAVLGLASAATAEATLVGWEGVSLSLVAVVAVAAAASMQLRQVGSWIANKVLGASSYGVYILHPFMVGPAKKLAAAAGLELVGFVMFTVVGSVVLALILERWFERPIQTYFKARAARDGRETRWAKPSQPDVSN